MADFKVSISFPVKRYIKKYLQKKYGKGPVIANRSDAIGYIVIALLNRTPDQSVNIIDQYNDLFEVQIPESIYTANGLFISKRQMRMFGRLVDNMFREDLFHFVLMANENYDQKYAYALQDFLAYYGITEDDVNSESLLKDFKRRKLKIINA